MGTGCLFWGDKNVLKLTTVMVTQLVNRPETSELYILQWRVWDVLSVSVQ